jgi:hypothetical protein
VLELFDDPEAREILRHWTMIHALGNVPSRATLEHSLRLEGRGVDTETVLDKVDKLFNRPLPDAKFIFRKLEKYSRDYNVITAAGNVLDAVQAGHYDAAAALLSRAVSTGSRSVKLAGDDWYETAPRLEKELIKGVLRRGYIGIFNGCAKSFKSWLLLHCGMAVATGQNWLEFATLAPARVLYVNMELKAEELKIRVDKLARAMGISRAALKGKMDFLNLAGFECGLEKMSAALRRLHDPEHPWELIIIDPVYKLLTAGLTLDTDNVENNNAAIGALFCYLEELAEELRAAIFLVHHFRKGNAADTAVVDSGAGGGVFGRDPSAVFALHPVRDEENEVVKGAYVVKSEIRYFENSIPDFGIRLDPASLIFHRDITINPEKLAGKAGRPQKYHIGQTLSILQGGRSVTFRQWKDHAKEEYGMNDRRMTVFRDEALEKEYVTASGPTTSHRTTYTLTPAGEEAMKVAERNSHLSAEARKVYSKIRGRNGNGDGEDKG